MTDLNNVNLVGRATRDISEKDFGYLSTGSAKLTISIAVNRSKKQGDQWVDETSYFDITCFGRMAENLKAKICKGVQIAVSGSLKQDRWQDQQGNNKSKVHIIADTVQVFGRANQTNGNGGNYPNEQARVLDQTFGNGYQNGYSEGQQNFANGQFQENIPFN